MITVEALRGYVLEELLATLLHASGYRLLVNARQDPDALMHGKHGLLVRGRGTNHQADVLGELVLPTPFSLPIRLFVEAKYRRRMRTGLSDVRNAYGVVHDINEQYASLAARRHAVPMRRYQYQYALFSATGFSRDAQQYALAQQISLIDLSGAAFADILLAADRTAEQMLAIADEYDIRSFPIGHLRTTLRFALGTWTASTPDFVQVEEAWKGRQIVEYIARLANQHSENHDEQQTGAPFAAFARAGADLAVTARRFRQNLLLGFPTASFVLALRPDRPDALAEYASRYGPDIRVNIRFDTHGNPASDWVIQPANGAGDFELRFRLPNLLADWVLSSDGAAPLRARDLKSALLSSISIIQHGRLVRLLFEPHGRSGTHD